MAVCIAALGVTGMLPLVSAARDSPSSDLAPKTGVYVGAYVAGGLPKRVRAFERRVGRKLAIDHRYWAWRDPWPTVFERWDVRHGRIPMVSWAYRGVGPLSWIASGRYDRLIQKRALAVREFGRPIFLRWGWEMNGSWMPWSGARNSIHGATDGPAKFRAAWRRIHTIFLHEGATNAIWIWCPNAGSDPNATWNQPSAYYPGDQYVDWICFDGFNWGPALRGARWRSFEKIFAPYYDAWSGRKPIMIGETASAERGGSKAQWIAEAAASLETRFPSIHALVWFNKREGTFQFPVGSSRGALRAYRKLGAEPYFHPPCCGSPKLSVRAMDRPMTVRPTDATKHLQSAPPSGQL